MTKKLDEKKQRKVKEPTKAKIEEELEQQIKMNAPPTLIRSVSIEQLSNGAFRLVPKGDFRSVWEIGGYVDDLTEIGRSLMPQLKNQIASQAVAKQSLPKEKEEEKKDDENAE